jgi:DNA invertase Pin-like site-specific DNA recombinase
MGIEVLDAFGDVGSGKSLDRQDRPGLFTAIEAATRRGVTLAVPAISRLLRSADYDAKQNPTAMPSRAEWKPLLKLLEGIEVLSLNDPDATPPADESFLRQLAADAKGTSVGRRRKPGRPRLDDDRRAKTLELVLRLAMKGMGSRRIARRVQQATGIALHFTTVCRWRRERKSSVAFSEKQRDAKNDLTP